MSDPTKRISDLGDLVGDVLVFGGPYSNLQATRALFQKAAELEFDASNLICTGDAVAYCANPVETVELLNGRCHWLAGNTEIQLRQGAADCGCGFEAGSECDLLSRGWYPFAADRLRVAEKDILGTCPDIFTFTNRGRRHAVVHGGVSSVSRFLWAGDPSAAFQQEIDLIQDLAGPVDTVISGHSGIAFERLIGDVTWLNAGVIGMPPNDGRPQTRFAVLTDVGPKIRRLDYDFETAAEAMADAGLTQGYDQALTSGRWPSEDVLPDYLKST